MPKKSIKPTLTMDDDKRVKASYGGKLKWVLNNLSDDQLTHCDDINPGSEEVNAFMTHAIDLGLEIKVGWDKFSDCYQATAIGAWVGFASEGYAVSGRSSKDAPDALLLLWYKIVVMSDFDISQNYLDREVEAMRG